ncbi:hypothetical protein [Kingella kingae]|nr:hypothetical protein [Kingella kingae]
MGVVVAHLFDVVPRGGLVLCVLLGLALGVDLPCFLCCPSRAGCLGAMA